MATLDFFLDGARRSQQNDPISFEASYGDRTPEAVGQDAYDAYIAAIKDEIETDPLNRGYAKLDPQAIADSLNNPVVTTVVENIGTMSRMADLLQIAKQSTGSEDLTGKDVAMDASGKVTIKNAGLETALKAAVDAELANDPLGLGYAGKTRAQALALLQADRVITREREQREQPRGHFIIASIPYAPNEISAESVQIALQ